MPISLDSFNSKAQKLIIRYEKRAMTLKEECLDADHTHARKLKGRINKLYGRMDKQISKMKIGRAHV